MATNKKLWSDGFGGKINNSVSRFVKDCSCYSLHVKATQVVLIIRQ